MTANPDLPYLLAEKYACKSLYWISYHPRGTTESAIFLKSGFFSMSTPLTLADYVYRTPLIMVRVQYFVMFCNGVKRFLVNSNTIMLRFSWFVEKYMQLVYYQIIHNTKWLPKLKFLWFVLQHFKITWKWDFEYRDEHTKKWINNIYNVSTMHGPLVVQVLTVDKPAEFGTLS